jgi:hypothetical protein
VEGEPRRTASRGSGRAYAGTGTRGTTAAQPARPRRVEVLSEPQPRCLIRYSTSLVPISSITSGCALTQTPRVATSRKTVSNTERSSSAAILSTHTSTPSPPFANCVAHLVGVQDVLDRDIDRAVRGSPLGCPGQVESPYESGNGGHRACEDDGEDHRALCDLPVPLRLDLLVRVGVHTKGDRGSRRSAGTQRLHVAHTTVLTPRTTVHRIPTTT